MKKIQIPSAKPWFDDRTQILKDIGSVLESGRLILGPYTKAFEEAFFKFIGTRYAVAMNSCTSALQTVFEFIGIENKEVIVPSNTFIACPNAVVYAKGKPIFADMNPMTFCSGLSEIQACVTQRTKAVLVVHIAGIPVPDIVEIRSFCDKQGLVLIEDVSHAHGTIIHGKKAGSFGHHACFSFYPTKNMTTGVGGMLVTGDKKLSLYAKSVRHHGAGESLDDMITFGSDLLMDEMRSVIGLSQLKSLKKNSAIRFQIGAEYSHRLKNCKQISYYTPGLNARPAYYKFPIILNDKYNKGDIIHKMSNLGIEVSSLYAKPCYLHTVYKKAGYKKGICPQAEKILKKQIALPVYARLSKKTVSYVSSALKKILEEQ